MKLQEQLNDLTRQLLPYPSQKSLWDRILSYIDQLFYKLHKQNEYIVSLRQQLRGANKHARDARDLYDRREVAIRELKRKNIDKYTHGYEQGRFDERAEILKKVTE